MKAFWGTLAALLTLAGPLSASPATPQIDGARQPPVSQAPVSIVVDSIALQDLSSDRVSFEVQSHVTATRTLRLQRVRFEQMRLGSLPVFMNPIAEKVDLDAGTPVALPAIPLTIYFRDLHSLAPLERVVSDGRATVDGEARVDLDLNVLERFASNQWNAHADMPVNVTVPVEIPGGFLGRAAALAALQAAQFALNIGASGGASGLNPLRHSGSQEDEIRGRYTPSLVIAESKYSLMRNQQRVDIVVRQSGFRISADEFVLTGEMIEPWKYDIDVAAAIRTGEASIMDGSQDLIVWPAGAAPVDGSTRSLAQGQIQLVHTLAKMESTEVPTAGSHMKVRLSRRDSNRNYAVLRFTHLEDQGVPVPIETKQEDVSRLALFRVDDRGRLEVVSTPAHREGDRWLLDEPLDNSAFGSILIADDGAVGMLQDEHSGMMLRDKTVRNKW